MATTNTKKDAVIEATVAEAPAKRFGSAAEPAWMGLNQTFTRLVLDDINNPETRILDSEWALIQTPQAGPVAFVDLIHGTIIPYNRVVMAIPA